MFGTLIVIDDELTEGHELGSGLIGKAQGFYASSLINGKSQTMAFTRSAVAESQLAVMGGTGNYVNAMGHAMVKTFQGADQQNNDGTETLLHFTVYLA
ncbi:putative dirigent protein [Helianthus anomalus]